MLNHCCGACVADRHRQSRNRYYRRGSAAAYMHCGSRGLAHVCGTGCVGPVRTRPARVEASPDPRRRVYKSGPARSTHRRSRRHLCQRTAGRGRARCRPLSNSTFTRGSARVFTRTQCCRRCRSCPPAWYGRCSQCCGPRHRMC